MLSNPTPNSPAPPPLPIADDLFAAPPPTRGACWRSGLSIAMSAVALLLLGATYLLMSPPRGGTSPGAIPWADGSILKLITDVMSLGGSVATARGTEIKDSAFQFLSCVALMILALRSLVAIVSRDERAIARGPAVTAQVFLVGWVALSAASMLWSREPGLALGQAALYGLALAWAVSLAWTLEGRDIPRVIWGYVVAAALGSMLCVAYYYIRNPAHRPGFPIGNPSTLAACTFPAFIVTGCYLVGTSWSARQTGQPLNVRIVATCGVLLVPLAWCLLLTDSRGAWIGLLTGVGGIFFLLAPRNVRWWIGSLMPLILLAGWWVLASNQDLAMARGATIRFRVYAWQYAAELWWTRTISGHGAGSFPTLASPLAIRDRALDPAAFLGDGVEHAHNELFEVLSEIGLLGGLTFVAGYVATLLAASDMLRVNLSPQRRFLYLGLVAALIGLMADSMFGVGLRLSGVPVVFYTLLGLLWAASRAVSRDARAEPRRPGAIQKTLRVLVALGATTAAVGGAWLALLNWSAATREFDAMEALAQGDAARAAALAQSAERDLLDPVRRLVVNDLFVRADYQQARAAYDEYRRRFARQATSGPASTAGESAARDAARQRVIDLAKDALRSAVEYNDRAPAFGRAPLFGARSAEIMFDLTRVDQPAESQQWWLTAGQAWREQLNQRRFDVTSLLALTHYASSTAELLGLLRDALRGGFPTAEWRERLQLAAILPDFDDTLSAMLQSVGPYRPETESDTLILTAAPEMHRLAAFAAAARGNFAAAEQEASAAAALYKPLRLRFPELRSVALAEQSDFGLRNDPGEARRWIAVLNESKDALPKIQEQKYEAMVEPYRVRLATAQLVAGDERAARALIAPSAGGDEATSRRIAEIYGELAVSFVRHPRANSLPIERWADESLRVLPQNTRAWLARVLLAASDGDSAKVERVIAAAAAAGLPPAEIERIRQLTTTRPTSR